MRYRIDIIGNRQKTKYESRRAGALDFARKAYSARGTVRVEVWDCESLTGGTISQNFRSYGPTLIKVHGGRP